jgi:hypothetical protein
MVPTETTSQRTRWSCWTIGLLSCLGAVALVVGAIVILVIYAMRQPEFRQAVSVGIAIQQCQENMKEIHAAIDRYRQRNNGKYPKDLNELVPRYLSVAGKLKCPSDTSTKPVSYQYSEPEQNTPDTAPLLQCNHHSVMNQKIPVIMLKNGQLLTPSRVQTRERLRSSDTDTSQQK